MYDIIIIGAGPAGLTAALYARRANKKVLVLEASTYGGQIVNAKKIENYPGIMEISGFEFATTLYNQVKNLNADIKFETVLRIDNNKNVMTNKETYKAKSIIIATGASNRRLKIDRENEFIGKGLSYCATCDGAFYKDKIVAVNGGGDNALEDAIYLSDIAKKVYIIHRRESFSAEAKYIDELNEKNNIEIIYNSNIIKLNGTNNIESIDIKDLDNHIKTIQIDGLFIAIGQEPKNEIFEGLIELDEKGYIKSTDGIHTNIDGIYVAGDTRVKELRQLTTATSDGSLAATTAIKELNKNTR